MHYLTDWSGECSRSMSVGCEDDPVLSAATFYSGFTFLSTSQLFNNSQVKFKQVILFASANNSLIIQILISFIGCVILFHFLYLLQDICIYFIIFPPFLFCIFAIGQCDATLFTKLAFLLTVIFKFCLPRLYIARYINIWTCLTV